MKKSILILSAAFLFACGGSKEETSTTGESTDTTSSTVTEPETEEVLTGSPIDTPQNAANTFCNKMQEVEEASEADKELLEQELNDLENKIEAEHEGDDAWFEEFETILEGICPEA